MRPNETTTRVTWAEDVKLNDKPTGNYSRFIGISDARSLRVVPLPLELEDLPSQLCGEVESIWDHSPHLCRLEDIFIKEGINQQSFWKRQEQQEKQDRDFASMGQNEPEDEDVDEEETASKNPDGLWQPGDPTSDSDSDDDESDEDNGIYDSIPVNGPYKGDDGPELEIIFEED
jgi:hypothetical protein